MNDTLQELRDLITRVVTGDGAQLENLSMTDAEWLIEARKMADDLDHFEITLKFSDWMAMIEVARNNMDIYPEED